MPSRQRLNDQRRRDEGARRPTVWFRTDAELAALAKLEERHNGTQAAIVAAVLREAERE